MRETFPDDAGGRLARYWQIFLIFCPPENGGGINLPVDVRHVSAEENRLKPIQLDGLQKSGKGWQFSDSMRNEGCVDCDLHE